MDLSNDNIQQNIVAHERVAHLYTSRHPEIYNSKEQQRLSETLKIGIDNIQTNSLSALDYGCGDGNLTRHLLQLGCHVTTADVTPSFTQIASSIDPSRTTPLILNGRDMGDVGDNTFDFIATYSVLHHIPDYLGAIEEMTRVLKPGGCLYIDHERCEDYWQPRADRDAFFRKFEQPKTIIWYIKQLLSPAWWVKKVKKTLNPRYQEEGDIHVWPDDHIQWPKIRELVSSAGCDVVLDQDYLHYQPSYDMADFENARIAFTDMRVLIVRKC